MEATRIEPISASELKTSSLFTPDLPSIQPFAASTGVLSRDILPSPEGFYGTESDSSPTERQRLEAHYVLYQTGACLGEPVKIDQRDDGIHISPTELEAVWAKASLPWLRWK